MPTAARRSLTLPVALMVAAGTPIEAPPIRIVGYNDMAEMLGSLTRRYAELYPGVRFAMTLKSTRSAPPALADASSDLAPMGAAMTPDDIAAIRSGRGAAPIEIAVAHDSLTPGALSSPTGVLVARSAAIRAISMPSLRRLLGWAEARPPTWRVLGVTGAAGERPIHVVGLAASTAIGRQLLDRMRLGAFSSWYRGLAQSRDVAAAVASDPDAIGLANLNNGLPTVRALDLIVRGGRRVRPDAAAIVAGHYPLDRRLLIYLRRDATGSAAATARDFVRFVLSDRGQRIVAAGAKGYLPLNPGERRHERKKLSFAVG